MALTVADDFSHEAVDIAVDYGISGQCVTRLLDQEALFRGYPAAVRTDNGLEFTCQSFIAWAQRHGIRHILIKPERPRQNGYIESFNGRFRDECLNEHWFETLHQARTEIAKWRRDYDEVRPHGSIGRIPPARFAEQHRGHAGDAARHLTPASNEIQQPSTRTPAGSLVWRMGACHRHQPLGAGGSSKASSSSIGSTRLTPRPQALITPSLRSRSSTLKAPLRALSNTLSHSSP